VFDGINIREQLVKLRRKSRKEGDELISEANRILQKDLFAEKKILENLKQYSFQSELLDEEVLDDDSVFTLDEIKQVAVLYRLKFLDSSLFKQEIPYEAILKIKDLDNRYHKKLKHFKILALSKSFNGVEPPSDSILFARTNYDNYYLVHRWGQKIKWGRKLFYAPMRRFETLFITLLIVTCILTLSLPTALITLDAKAEYWSGYRFGTFFHLLIFNMGVTAYLTFAFGLNFNSSVWNRLKDFD
jgi:hypothetical protein